MLLSGKANNRMGRHDSAIHSMSVSGRAILLPSFLLCQ